MAENNEDRNPDDLSDEASPYRLEEFRKKGQVSQSKELVALAVAVTCGMALFAMAPSLSKELTGFMKDVFSDALSMKPGDQMEQIAGHKLLQMVKVFATVGLPIALLGFFLGIFGHLAQIGFLFTSEPLAPDFNKINPLEGLKRLFSVRNLIETARVTFKGVILCFVAYSILKTAILKSPTLVFKHPTAIFEVLGDSGKTLFYSLCGILGIFAGIDFF